MSIAAQAFLGSTSVKNPLTPMLIERMGGSGLGRDMHVRNIVPSPPIVMMKSVFIFVRGSISSLVATFPVSESSM